MSGYNAILEFQLEALRLATCNLQALLDIVLKNASKFQSSSQDAQAVTKEHLVEQATTMAFKQGKATPPLNDRWQKVEPFCSSCRTRGMFRACSGRGAASSIRRGKSFDPRCPSQPQQEQSPKNYRQE